MRLRFAPALLIVLTTAARAENPAGPSGCEHSAWLGDGSCDVVNNNDVCNWDGGDCCEDTAKGGVVDTTYCPGDCVCRDPTSDYSGTVYATFDDLENYHGPDIQVASIDNPVVLSTANWFVNNLNSLLAVYSSSRLSLQKVLHCYSESDTVFFNEVVAGEQVQFPVLGRTYSVVVLTEQRVNSRLYREIEVPLWEVRNATIFNTTFSYEPPYLIHHHIPPRSELPDSVGFSLADLVVDSLNKDEGRDRYTISHYGNAERQCLDIDDTDLFYELDDSTGRVTICLNYVHFACEDNLPTDMKDYTNPRLFIAAIYTDPNKVSTVVSVMDLQTTTDVSFAALKRVVQADNTWSDYYSEFSSGKEPWVFLFLALLIACVGIGIACVCNRASGKFFKNDVEMRENVSLKYESAKLDDVVQKGKNGGFTPVSTVEF